MAKDGTTLQFNLQSDMGKIPLSPVDLTPIPTTQQFSGDAAEVVENKGGKSVGSTSELSLFCFERN